MIDALLETIWEYVGDCIINENPRTIIKVTEVRKAMIKRITDVPAITLRGTRDGFISSLFQYLVKDPYVQDEIPACLELVYVTLSENHGNVSTINIAGLLDNLVNGRERAITKDAYLAMFKTHYGYWRAQNGKSLRQTITTQLKESFFPWQKIAQAELKKIKTVTKKATKLTTVAGGLDATALVLDAADVKRLEARVCDLKLELYVLEKALLNSAVKPCKVASK